MGSVSGGSRSGFFKHRSGWRQTCVVWKQERRSRFILPGSNMVTIWPPSTAQKQKPTITVSMKHFYVIAFVIFLPRCVYKTARTNGKQNKAQNTRWIYPILPSDGTMKIAPLKQVDAPQVRERSFYFQSKLCLTHLRSIKCTAPAVFSCCL